MSRGALVRRFFGFTAIPMISFIVPMFLLPIVSRIGGVDGWASIGVGQAVGTFATVATSYGWNVVGGARAALEHSTLRRQRLYAEAFWTRVTALVVVMPIAAVIAYVLGAGADRPAAALMAVAGALTGMSLDWYAVGTGSPSTILWFETIPTALAMACAVPVLLITRNLVLYPVLLILGLGTGLILLNIRLFRRPFPPLLARREWAGALRGNFVPALIDSTAGAYSSAPVPFSRAFGTISLTASIASADKVYRIGLMAIVVTGNALQGWVLAVPANERWRRHLASFVLHGLVAVIGFAVLVFGGPLISSLFLGEAVAASNQLFLWYGIAYIAISLTTPFIRNILIPAERNATVLAATVAAAVVGLLLMVILGALVGAVGVLIAYAVSEVTIFVALLIPALHVVFAQRHVPDEAVPPAGGPAAREGEG